MRPEDQVRRDRTTRRGDRAVDRRAWLLGSLGLLTVSLVAQVQAQVRVFRIGLLGGSSRTSPESSHIWSGFFEGLRALGYIEGQNIIVEERWYGDKIERIHDLTDELVKLRVDVIVVGLSRRPRRPSAPRRRFRSS